MNVSFNYDGTVNLHFERNLTITIELNEAKKIGEEVSSFLFKSLKEREKKIFTSPCNSKRSFPSIEAAKLNNQRAGWRMRVYLCEYCHLYHVTNADKNGSGEGAKIKKRKTKNK